MPFLHTSLSPAEADHLEHYLIRTQDNSLLNKYVLIPYFFEPIARAVPSFFVPNMITLIGNLAPLLVFLFLAVFFPDTSVKLPWWGNVLMAGSTLTFWICDSLDGMRARATGICSPIGDWLDHSLDNVTYFCFIYFLDRMFLMDSWTEHFLIVIFLVYTSYCVQIEAVYTNAIHLAIINASCEGLLGFIGILLFDIVFPLDTFTVFGISAYFLIKWIMAGLLVIHSCAMLSSLWANEQLPVKEGAFHRSNQFKDALLMYFQSFVPVIIGLVFFHLFDASVNYAVYIVWVDFCSLIYVDAIIQCRLFGRPVPTLLDPRYLVAQLPPLVLAPIIGFELAIWIGAAVAGSVMWSDWVVTVWSMLKALGLELFQTTPTRFAPKKPTN